MSKQFNLYIDEEIQQLARKQAESLGLKVSDYTAMLYHLDLSELVRKAIDKARKSAITDEVYEIGTNGQYKRVDKARKENK